jgi:hypothetical protein
MAVSFVACFLIRTSSLSQMLVGKTPQTKRPVVQNERPVLISMTHDVATELGTSCSLITENLIVTSNILELCYV